MKCQDVQEKLWCAEMTEEMLDHLAGCESCSAEWKLIQGVGMSVEQMEVPMQTKSLLPPREVMEEVVQSVRKKRRTGYVSGGVAAACLLLAFWQGPDFWRSGPAGIASQAETAKAPGEKAVSELAGAAKSSSPESLQRDVLEPRGNGMLGKQEEPIRYEELSADEVLRRYLDAVNRADLQTANALLSKRALEDELQPMNMLKAELVELTEVAQTSDVSKSDAAEVREYEARVRPAGQDTSNEAASFTWTIRMVKETADAPWKVDRYSVTGP